MTDLQVGRSVGCYNGRTNAPLKLLALELVKVANSTGVVLPKDVLARLGVGVGDTLNASIDERGMTNTRSDDGFDAQLAARARG